MPYEGKRTGDVVSFQVTVLVVGANSNVGDDGREKLGGRGSRRAKLIGKS
ncbi:hypothetical protein Q2T83_17945 [Fervidibacter sacchari]|uniref:Uncharacterized protein n=1 Tax=Candidatus Fervidibacter sacchari TaxID=1448929 RepID=A0ABT2EKD3_9BACT|nr:hypothetical protein [Candidatus Fervidibacter sacchari]MCS3918408.1 hypothetical protein [Candidatus Fervidibacter sacchari]WKU16193.1 hypothetical protein Q2T83_17945 [Candidatus Fervidibacter sacchari]